MAWVSTFPHASMNSGTDFLQWNNAPVDSIETVFFYIKSTEYPNGHFLSMTRPEHIECAVPEVKIPPFPAKRQLSLRVLEPCVFFVQYPCRQHCRSLGICIHYQFVAGCRNSPDGLRCPVCAASGEQVAIQAGRMCPLHQDPAQANPINSRPEDFLATQQQKLVYDHILERSFACFWDDLLPPPADDSVDNNQAMLRHEDVDREATPRTFEEAQVLESMM